MNICPCCGEKLSGEQALVDCAACGARAVGPPLARPERELPGYGRALAVGAAGALLLLFLSVGTVVALVERQPFSLAFWNVMGAAETAAWRLKALTLPFAVLALWPSVRVVRTLRREPARFAGLRLASAGLSMSAAVVVAFAVLIGLTVPARLQQRAAARQAAEEAVAYDVSRVLLQYQIRYGTYPARPEDLREKLPDPDGAVARVAELIRPSYEPVSDIASLPAAGTKTRRGAAALRVRSTALRTGVDDTPDEGLAFTGYKVVLPGADKKLGTPDDITLRDGRLVATPPVARTSRGDNTP
ncbi:MAG TPA: hypothetical protein VF546_03925 [Pyrinomonadaceae bacterium]